MNASIDEVSGLRSKHIISDCSKAILKTLLYFNIFKYPLREEEIIQYLSIQPPASIETELNYLVSQNYISYHQGFYFIGEDKEIINRRLKGNLLAEKYLKITTRHVQWLSAIPFIKCICISGSLSKNYMDDKSDIDYFIITEHNRLWIVRFVLSVVYKVFVLLGKKKYICPNYIITEYNLEIKDRNIFTAIEIATLIPMYNLQMYMSFMNANRWVSQYFPNMISAPNIPLTATKIPKTVDLGWITAVDNYFYNFYRKHYQHKFNDSQHLGTEDLSYKKEVYKMHISGHRNKILEKYEEMLRFYQTQHDISLLV
jgi:hypothetical protein